MGIDCDVAICGGGLGGLALAAGLHRRGYNVLVFESAPSLRTTTSTLVGLGTNAFLALSEIHPGIVPQLRAVGCPGTSMVKGTRKDKHSEAEVVTTPTSGPNPSYAIPWAKVQEILSGFVPSDKVHCGYRCTGFTESPDGGPVKLHFKGQKDVIARLAVDCSGLRAALRNCMVPNDPGPRYLGHMNYNALIYNPNNSVVDAHAPGEMHCYTDRPYCCTPQWTITTSIVDAGSSYTFWQVRFESEEPSFVPTPFTEAREGEEGEAQQQEAARPAQGGMGRPGTKAHVEQILEEYGFDHMVKVVKATPESAIFERAMTDLVPLDELGASLVSKGGRVVLLGDAAHAMHSGPGQGARMAFEDAHVLVMLLDQHRKQLTRWTGGAPAQATMSNTALAQALLARSAAGAGATDSEQPHTSRARGESHTGHADSELLEDPEELLDCFATRLSAGPRLQATPAVENNDLNTLSKVLSGYNSARLARVCRIQRLAAENAGLEALRTAVAPQGLTPLERRARAMEVFRWLNQYPDNPSSDPESVYWQPPAPKHVASPPGDDVKEVNDLLAGLDDMTINAPVALCVEKDD